MSAPEWASREFCRRANLIYDEVVNDSHDRATALRFAVALGAELIAQHEEPPVDPLEAALATANSVLKGEGDGTYDEIVDALREVLTALEVTPHSNGGAASFLRVTEGMS